MSTDAVAEPPSRRAAESERGLVRVLGVRALAATMFNIVIGSGIFVLPALAAGMLGRAAPLAYVACAVLIGLVMLCFAESGSRVSLTGGPYAYVEVAFGPFAGVLIGMLLWVLNVFGSAAVATALTGNLGARWPALAGTVPRGVLIVVGFTVLAAINVRGVREGVRLVELMTVAKLLPLALLLVVGLRAPWAEAQGIVMPASGGALATAVVTIVFAFAGTESALVPGGEMRDPARTVPRALGVAMLSITALYIALQIVAQGVLGTDALTAAKDAPLVAAAARASGAKVAAVVAAGAAISMFGNLSGMTFAVPRGLYALARDGFLPAPLATVHPRFRTPHVAIVVHAAITAAIALVGRFAQLARLATVALLLMYLVSCAATWMLQHRDVREAGEPFRIPLGPVVPLLGCVAIGWVLSKGASGAELAFAGGILLVATVLFFLRRRPSAEPPSRRAAEPT